MAFETNRFKKRQQSMLIDLVSARKRGSARPVPAPSVRKPADRPLFAKPAVARQTELPSAPTSVPPAQSAIVEPSTETCEVTPSAPGKLWSLSKRAKNLVIVGVAGLPQRLSLIPGSKRTKTIVSASVALLVVLGGSIAAFGGSANPKSVSDGATAIQTSNGNAVIAPATPAGSQPLNVASVPLAASQPAATPTSKAAGTTTKTTATKPAPKITFTPVVPFDEPELAKNGTADGTINAYTFDDLFEGTPVQVSEQPLPIGYPTVEKAISTIATKIKANTAIPTASNGNAYMASKFQNVNQQVVVFSDKYLLIFVQSKTEHEAVNWPNYLNKFR